MQAITLPNAATSTPLPTRWGEVTLGQFERLTELPERSDVYNFLSVFLNLSPVEVMNLPSVFVNEQVLPVLEFAVNTVPDFEHFELRPFLNLPGETAITARSLPVAKSLEYVAFGQATDLGALLQDEGLPLLQKRQRALAIVFYPPYVGGEYDSDAIEDFATKVCSQATLEEALPITDFFLLTSTESVVVMPPNSSASPSTLTSAPPASSPWWKSGIRWPWSTPSPVETKPSGPSFSPSHGAR